MRVCPAGIHLGFLCLYVRKGWVGHEGVQVGDHTRARKLASTRADLLAGPGACLPEGQALRAGPYGSFSCHGDKSQTLNKHSSSGPLSQGDPRLRLVWPPHPAIASSLPASREAQACLPKARKRETTFLVLPCKGASLCLSSPWVSQRKEVEGGPRFLYLGWPLVESSETSGLLQAPRPLGAFGGTVVLY